MECRILNSDFIDIGLVEEWASLIWTDRYYEYGDFSLELPFLAENIAWYEIGNYVIFSESEHAMVVEEVSFKKNNEDGLMVSMSGRSLESLLTRRIGWVDQDNLGPYYPPDMIKALLINNFISPENAARTMPQLFLDSDDKFTAVKDKLVALYNNAYSDYSQEERMSMLVLQGSYVGTNIYEAVKGICESYSIGFKMTFVQDAVGGRTIKFSPYFGENRAIIAKDSDRAYVVYSSAYDTLTDSSYTESKTDEKNLALVGGEGEGSDRIFVSAYSTDETPSGILRKEVFVDASNISKKYEVTIDDETETRYMTNDQYYPLLIFEGQTELANSTKKVEVEAELGSLDVFAYKADYDLGDIIQVVDDFGHTIPLRITEMCYSSEGSGITMHPTTVALSTESEELYAYQN